MGNIKNKVLPSFLIVFGLSVLYLNTNFYLRSVQWKYKDGYHIGDWVVFRDENLTYRTIYEGKKPVARVVFCIGKELIIEDIETQEKGFYTKK